MTDAPTVRVGLTAADCPWQPPGSRERPCRLRPGPPSSLVRYTRRSRSGARREEPAAAGAAPAARRRGPGPGLTSDEKLDSTAQKTAGLASPGLARRTGRPRGAPGAARAVAARMATMGGRPASGAGGRTPACLEGAWGAVGKAGAGGGATRRERRWRGGTRNSHLTRAGSCRAGTGQERCGKEHGSCLIENSVTPSASVCLFPSLSLSLSHSLSLSLSLTLSLLSSALSISLSLKLALCYLSSHRRSPRPTHSPSGQAGATATASTCRGPRAAATAGGQPRLTQGTRSRAARRAAPPPRRRAPAGPSR